MRDDEEEDDRVGYGHPPKATRWEKGCPSPNPGGRPRNVLAETYHADIVAMINKPVRARQNGREVKLTLSAASFTKLVNKAIKGDNAATAHVLNAARAITALARDQREESTRYQNSVRKLAAMIFEDPAEQQRMFEEYHSIQRLRRGGGR